jgi:PAS domain S-box-containing protein
MLVIGLAATAVLVVAVRLIGAARRARRAMIQVDATLRDLLETIRDPIEGSTADGRITYVNAAWRALFGSDAPPRSERVFVDPAATVAYAESRARVLAGGPDEVFEGIVIGRGGQRVMLSIRSSVRCEGGVPVAVRSIMRDVSEQRAAEEAQGRLVEMIEATSDFVGIAGGNGRIVYLNRAGRRLVGIGETDDVTGFGMRAVFPPEARAHQIAVAVPSALRDGVWSGETVVRGATGGEIPVSQVVVAHRSMGGGDWFVSMIMRDRSEQAHREAESEAMHRIALGIVDLTDATSVYLTVVRELCATTGWPLGELWLRDDDGRISRAAVWPEGEAGLTERVEDGVGLPSRVWASRAVTVVSDRATSGALATGADPGDGAAVRPGFDAAVGVPVLADRELVAVVVLHLRAPTEDDRRRIRLVTAVAAQLGRMLVQKRAEQALRESEARTRTLSDASMDGIAIIRDFRIVELNDAFRRMFALGEDVSGVNSLDLVDRPDRARIATVARAPGMYEATMRRVDGTTFDGRVTGVETVYRGAAARIAVVRDITEWRALDRLKNEFVSTVSHELRTPLTAIRGSLGLLEAGVAGALTPKAQSLVRIGRTNTERLIRLINDMLDLDRIAAGKLALRRARLVIADVVRVAVEEMRGLAAQRAIGIIEEVTSRVAIFGDRDRMVQVLTNLLSNAIKFAPAGSLVVVRACRVGGGRPDTGSGERDASRGARVRVSVSNTGAGIAAADIGRLFTRFQQLDGSDNRRNYGSGLGLAISKELVEQHDGTIGVDSTPGVETTFWFECREDRSVGDAAGAGA